MARGDGVQMYFIPRPFFSSILEMIPTLMIRQLELHHLL